MLEKVNLFPIAIGTYGLGGNMQKTSSDVYTNSLQDKRALEFSLQRGQNVVDASLSYDNERTVNFLAKAVKQFGREKVFINAKIEKYITKQKDVDKQVEKYLNLFETDYLDCLTIHAPSVLKVDLQQCYDWLQGQVDQQKTRFLGASNLSPTQLKNVCQNHKLCIFEGLYNIDCKHNEKNGILNVCKENRIEFLAFQPLRRNRIEIGSSLDNLKTKYSCTNNQIFLSWLIHEKKVVPIVKSANIEHIKDNLLAVDMVLEPEDYKILNDYENIKFSSLKVDWSETEGIPVYQIPNQKFI